MSTNSCCWPCTHEYDAQSPPELVKLRRYFYTHVFGFILPLCLILLAFLLLFLAITALLSGIHEKQHLSDDHLTLEHSASSLFPHWLPSPASSSLAALASSFSSSSSFSTSDLVSEKQLAEDEGMKNPEIETQRTSDPEGFALYVGVMLWFTVPVIALLVALGCSFYASLSVYHMTCRLMQQDALSLPLSHSSGPLAQLRAPGERLRVFNIGQLVAMSVGWVAFALVFVWSYSGYASSAWLCQVLEIVAFSVYTAFYHMLLDRLYARFTTTGVSRSHLPIPDAVDIDSDTTVGYREGEVPGLRG